MDEGILSEVGTAAPETAPEVTLSGEGQMVSEEAWREVHRLFHVGRQPKAASARRLDVDRKTVHTILQQAAWQPYRRAERTDTLLAGHAAYLQRRAPAVVSGRPIVSHRGRAPRFIDLPGFRF